MGYYQNHQGKPDSPCNQNQKKNLLNSFHQWLNTEKILGTKLIIGGDFNARLRETDKGNTNVGVDTYVHNWIIQNNKKGKTFSRIDQIVTSPNVKCSKITTHAESPSPDHFPISLELSGAPTTYNLNRPTNTKFILTPERTLSFRNQINITPLQPETSIHTIMNIANRTLTKLPKTRYVNQKGKKISYWNTESGIVISQIKWAARALTPTEERYLITPHPFQTAFPTTQRHASKRTGLTQYHRS
eukprot:TRINITY_DN1460_c0_g1_i11.p1 TRINITY_DN1460_c0_g1~~TRINITY_DN1460_c0_g1_i11.p1  ORF type:complete len:244 (-),score=29.22 TRINITY_DN1460_c0_g1_i11:2396-3127(-)